MARKYSEMSPAARVKRRNLWRRANLRKKLRSGKMPTLRKYLPGAEKIYEEFNIKPNVDVFIPRFEPSDSFPKELELRARRNFKYNKYIKQSLRCSPKSSSELDRLIRKYNGRNLKEEN